MQSSAPFKPLGAPMAGPMAGPNKPMLLNNGAFDSFDFLGMKQKPSGEQQKDFRKLESELIKTCAKQCLRREMHFEQHSEFCMTKCYDLGFIYTRLGIVELHEFTQENSIRS